MSVQQSEVEGTHRPITKFSGEQVIISQLHALTQSGSQMFKALCRSRKASLMLIKASTATNEIHITKTEKKILFEKKAIKKISKQTYTH